MEKPDPEIARQTCRVDVRNGATGLTRAITATIRNNKSRFIDPSPGTAALSASAATAVAAPAARTRGRPAVVAAAAARRWTAIATSATVTGRWTAVATATVTRGRAAVAATTTVTRGRTAVTAATSAVTLGSLAHDRRVDPHRSLASPSIHLRRRWRRRRGAALPPLLRTAGACPEPGPAIASGPEGSAGSAAELLTLPPAGWSWGVLTALGPEEPAAGPENLLHPWLLAGADPRWTLPIP